MTCLKYGYRDKDVMGTSQNPYVISILQVKVILLEYVF